MTAPAERDSIRVLVDQYHDSGWRSVRQDLEGGSLRVTISRRRLTWATLRRYHVAIVEASTPVPFTAAELSALERFVLGRETPLEGYLQRRAEIEPQVNSAVMGLLETLFPQVPIVERWGW